MFLRVETDNMGKIFMKEKSMKKIMIALTLGVSLLPAQVVGMNKFQLQTVSKIGITQSPTIGNSRNSFLTKIVAGMFVLGGLSTTIFVIARGNVRNNCKYSKNKKSYKNAKSRLLGDKNKHSVEHIYRASGKEGSLRGGVVARYFMTSDQRHIKELKSSIEKIDNIKNKYKLRDNLPNKSPSIVIKIKPSLDKSDKKERFISVTDRLHLLSNGGDTNYNNLKYTVQERRKELETFNKNFFEGEGAKKLQSGFPLKKSKKERTIFNVFLNELNKLKKDFSPRQLKRIGKLPFHLNCVNENKFFYKEKFEIDDRNICCDNLCKFIDNDEKFLKNEFETLVPDLFRMRQGKGIKSQGDQEKKVDVVLIYCENKIHNS